MTGPERVGAPGGISSVAAPPGRLVSAARPALGLGTGDKIGAARPETRRLMTRAQLEGELGGTETRRESFVPLVTAALQLLERRKNLGSGGRARPDADVKLTVKSRRSRGEKYTDRRETAM